jgi:hypothetical protein
MIIVRDTERDGRTYEWMHIKYVSTQILIVSM